MISIIIIIIKITSPTNNLPSSTSQKWNILKTVCVSVVGWAVVWVPPRWRAGGGPGVINRGTLTSLRLVLPAPISLFLRLPRVQRLFSVGPVFFFSPFQCRISLPPSFLALLSFFSYVAFLFSRVSAPGRSCSTSVWSTHGCRTWTSAPAGSRPLCWHLCTLERERRELR